MGYRNQPVIQDFYGLKDLAKATSQIGTSAARAVDKINASFRLAQEKCIKTGLMFLKT